MTPVGGSAVLERPIDGRSDLWSLAVIVFQCITGHMPFGGATLGDLFVKICTVDAPMPSAFLTGLPSSFDGWMAKALAKAPEDRHQTTTDFYATLETALTGSGEMTLRSAELALAQTVPPVTPQAVATLSSFSSARAPAPPEPPRPRRWRGPVVAFVGAVAIGVAAVLGLGRGAHPDASPLSTGGSGPRGPLGSSVGPTASDQAAPSSAAVAASSAAGAELAPPLTSAPATPSSTARPVGSIQRRPPSKATGDVDLGY